MSKHTPAPWRAAGKHIVQDDGGVVAYVTAYAKPTPRQLADARLIAAAPELLSIAIRLRDAGVWPDLAPALEAAIAKATGKAK